VYNGAIMRRLFSLVIIALLLIPLAVIGCKRGGDGDELEINLAPIYDIRVNIAESYPLQVLVYLKGGLADSCTIFNEIKTEYSGNTIDIEVTTQRPKDAVCTQVHRFFEKNMNLGSDFISGGTYTINVNDKTTSFVMQ